jgi:hypothetical protein
MIDNIGKEGLVVDPGIVLNDKQPWGEELMKKFVTNSFWMILSMASHKFGVSSVAPHCLTNSWTC